jgi:hypothetical protein
MARAARMSKGQLRQKLRQRSALLWVAWALSLAASACGTAGADATGESVKDSISLDAADSFGDTHTPTTADGAATPDSALPGDASPSADLVSGDSQPGNDTSPSDTSTPAPPTTGVCFTALPSASTFTGTEPMPIDSCPELGTPEWFYDQPVLPPPTLAMQIGRRDPSGQWHPLQNGDWIGLETAMQGGFHLDLVPRVLLPGQTAAKLQLQTEAIGDVSCNPVANLNMAKAWLIADPAAAGSGQAWYTTDNSTQAFVIFGVSVAKKHQFCGLWVTARWRLRLPGTAQWGEVVRTLRTYDATGLPSRRGGAEP